MTFPFVNAEQPEPVALVNAASPDRFAFLAARVLDALPRGDARSVLVLMRAGAWLHVDSIHNLTLDEKLDRFRRDYPEVFQAP